MNFKKLASRITGITSPIFGVSWNPPEPDVKRSERVIAFMEDRRVLYNSYAWEELVAIFPFQDEPKIEAATQTDAPVTPDASDPTPARKARKTS
jgi:hypothetical protein